MKERAVPTILIDPRPLRTIPRHMTRPTSAKRRRSTNDADTYVLKKGMTTKQAAAADWWMLRGGHSANH